MHTALLIGDLHIGKATPTYNREVFAERMNIFLNNFINWKKLINKSMAMEDLNIFLLGDIVDGENIYRGHAWEVEMDVDEAIDIGIDTMESFLENLEKRTNFKEINIYCTQGNHGRSSSIGSKNANWDRVLYKLMKERLDYNVEITKDWYGVANIGGAKILYFHGDNVRMNSQIPFYGLVRLAMRLRGGGIEENDFDYLFLGHFHTVNKIVYNDVGMYINGTTVTRDSYTEKVGLRPNNDSWVIVLNDDGDVIIENTLNMRKTIQY